MGMSPLDVGVQGREVLDVAVAPAMRLDVDAVPVVLARVAEEIALPVLVERARVPIGGRTPIGATTTPRRRAAAMAKMPLPVPMSSTA
jgi:hypothetical protein